MLENQILTKKISKFTNAVKNSLTQENWYAALSLALTLPDICGKLENPSYSSTKRYALWFDTYVLDNYSFTDLYGNLRIFLSGNDAYALRCAYLHGGEGDISSQRVQELLESFIFLAPKIINGKFEGAHSNQIDKILQLRVDIFCLDICNGVDMWMENKYLDPKIQRSVQNMLEIHTEGATLNVGGVKIEIK